jgi:3D (Asp-Asp-Asp) domain-containing protein
MNKRWRKRIDIYMGTDVQKAKKWGKKNINIEYCLPIKLN